MHAKVSLQIFPAADLAGRISSAYRADPCLGNVIDIYVDRPGGDALDAELSMCQDNKTDRSGTGEFCPVCGRCFAVVDDGNSLSCLDKDV